MNLLVASGIMQVYVGVVLITAASAVVGVFALLRKNALAGDAIAHAVLPGIALAFWVSGSRSLLYLVPGAVVTGVLAYAAIEWIPRISKLKADTAIAVVLSVFFGVGIFILTLIQNTGQAAQSGIDTFLFGKAAAMTGSDLLTFSVIAVFLLLVVLLFYKELKLWCFDEAMAKSSGLPVSFLKSLLVVLTVLAIVAGIQAVGLVLMAALLITPGAAARYWSHRLPMVLLIAAFLAASSGLLGTHLSFLWSNVPTGPVIVLVLSVGAIASFFLAPNRGVLFRQWKNRKSQKSMLDENVLKEMYHLGEKDGQFTAWRTLSELLTERSFPSDLLSVSLKRLVQANKLKREDHTWAFTEVGLREGKRLARLHRLWELYLERYMNIASDHVHEDAETIEHVITPELEEELTQLLDFPESDPHKQNIPYDRR